MSDEQDTQRPPRDNIYRAVFPAVELRSASDDVDSPSVMRGHFAVFNVWTEIRSALEGRFLERIAPGAFKRAFARRNGVRVLLNHGNDPQVGDKPIASITELREDDTGAYYEAELLDGLPPLVMSGLRAGEYGASFRFSVPNRDAEEWRDDPKPSAENPERLPERTIRDLQLFEFGPVTFPAYPDATAGVRSITSLTDDFFEARIRSDPDRLAQFLERFRDLNALPTPGLVAEPHSEEGTREQAPVSPPTPVLIRSDAEWATFLQEIA
jgi:HK97 family phage prohead protease